MLEQRLPCGVCLMKLEFSEYNSFQIVRPQFKEKFIAVLRMERMRTDWQPSAQQL